MRRCHAATSAFSPGCASLIASYTPTRPRATRLLRNSVQNASVSAAPTSRPMISRRPASWTACAITTLAGDAAAVADLLDLRIDEHVRIAALQRALTKRLHLLIQQTRDPGHLTLGDPQPESLDELIDTTRAHATDVGLLHHTDERLLTTLARLKNDGKYEA